VAVRASLVVTLAAFSFCAAAQDLGTLFHAPKEREALDRLRSGEPAERAELPRREPAVTGYVKRSDGKSTVFLDKQPYPAKSPTVQRLLEPGAIERYEPAPPPVTPAAPASMEGGKPSAKAPPEKKATSRQSKGGEEQ
jgi:hypothetical protein